MPEETAPQNSQELSLIDQANKTAERIEKANAQLKELLDRQERVESRRILGGGSEAGKAVQPTIDPREAIKQEARQFFKGTEIERYLQ